MQEEVYKTHDYWIGFRVDKQLLLSLEDIFMQYNSNTTIKINAECSNNTVYKFDGVEECCEYFEKAPYRIIKIEIEALFGERYDSNKIVITLRNTVLFCSEVKFRFDNSDDYLKLKNKIELCLKNFRLNYRFLSVTPILPVLFTIIFIGICVYTANNDIVFPIEVQRFILSAWIGGSAIVLVFPPIDKLKRTIFPCVEFRLGQNILIEDRHATIRNFIIGTLILGTVLGVLVNYISEFLF